MSERDGALPVHDTPRYYVYQLSRLDGSPFYIGKGHHRRIWEHENRAVAGRSKKDDIILEILAQGKEVPKKILVKDLTNQEALNLEQKFIAGIGREPSGPLVNLTAGGEPRQETPIELLRQRALDRWADPEFRATAASSMQGLKRTEASKERMRAAQLDPEVQKKIQTPESRLRKSISCTGKNKGRPKPEGFAAMVAETWKDPEIRAKRLAKAVGRVQTPETKAKISATNNGRKHTPEELAKMRGRRGTYRARHAQEDRNESRE